MRRTVLALAAAAALLAPAVASADSVRLQGGALSLQATGARDNSVRIVQSGGNIAFDDNIGDGMMLTADSEPGCKQRGFNVGVTCSIDAVKTIQVDLFDGNDQLLIALPPGGAPVTASGGSGVDLVSYVLAPARMRATLDGSPNDGPLPGHDNIGTDFEGIRGGSGADALTDGESGGSLFGLRGKDHLTGGRGDDVIDARDIDNCPFLGGDCSEPREQDTPERDTVHCGAGTDIVDGDAEDRIARDCEFVAIANTVDLSGRSDTFTAFRSGLIVHGGAGNDHLTGSLVQSVDSLDGGRGNDVIEGLAGPDTVTGGPGRDTLASGLGDDIVRARDGERDNVNCGAGKDTAVVDRKDKVSPNCETISRK